MKLTIKRITPKWKELIFEHESTTIKMDMLNEEQQKELCKHLQEVIDELKET